MLARFVTSLPNGISQQITRLYFRVLSRHQRGAHSYPEYHQYRTMDVQILPALQDNYMYLLVDTATNEAAVVDPVDPATVIDTISNCNVRLTSVLTTHHHWDHAGGNEALAKQITGLQVYGADDRIAGLTKKVEHNSFFNVGNLLVQCLFTPCHTRGHMCYYVTTPEEGSQPVVFTGDTLFLGGCGRFFEGTAVEMFSAMEMLRSLPDETKVYCGHEYSTQNLKFAAHVEPNNADILDKLAWARQRREEGKPTVPSTIGEEKKYNPFMRVSEAAVMLHAKSRAPVEAMKKIRHEKDNWQHS